MKPLSSLIGDAETIGDFLSIWLGNELLESPYQQVFERYYWSYRRSFGKRMRLAYSEQIKEALEIVQMRPNMRVLEVGFGLGTESLWLAMHGANVVAIEIKTRYLGPAIRRKEIVEQHTGLPLSCEFQRVSLLDLEPEESFDLVWMEQAFHHVEPREAAVDKLLSITKPGGYIVISEVNALNPLMQLQLLLNRGTNVYSTYLDEDGKEHIVGNERIITAPRLKKTLSRRSVSCKSIRYFRVFPNHPIFDGMGRVEKLLAKNWLAPLNTHYNYVGQREE